MRLLTEGQDPILADLDWASGFAFFDKTQRLKHFGGFDRNLPDYGNELELCKRVAAKGYRRVWVRNAYIHHLGGQSYERFDWRGSYCCTETLYLDLYPGERTLAECLGTTLR